MRIPEDAKCLIRKTIEDENIDNEERYDLLCSIMVIVGQTAYQAGRADQLEKVMCNMRIVADE